MPAVFLLIHSPIVGPQTWQAVALDLKARGLSARVPRLSSPPRHQSEYWRLHANAAAAGAGNGDYILVAHSGAGPLSPAISQQAGRQPLAYVFVDAQIPEGGKSRLDLFGDPDAVREFRAGAVGGLVPPWCEEDLEAHILDPDVRRSFVAGLEPMPLRVYEEVLPISQDWPDAPCVSLAFGDNPAYDGTRARATELGWPQKNLPGSHFALLNDAATVTAAILSLLTEAGCTLPASLR